MKTYTWLFLDADDTLFDYGKAEAHALAGAFADLSLPYSPATMQTYQVINQQAWAEFEKGAISALQLRSIRFSRLFAHMGIDADPQHFSNHYLEHLSRGTFLIDGAAQLLEQLRGHYRLGMITNGLPEVQRPRLDGAGIAAYFEFVAISEEVGIAKPDPAFFDAALALAGSPDRRRVLVIGDSLSSDIRGGIQSGLDTLWFNPAGKIPDERWRPTYQVNTLNAVVDLLLDGQLLT